MKVAVYPGSFNPWHDGHKDVLEKALKVFDKVVIAIGSNPDKTFSDDIHHRISEIELENINHSDRIEVVVFSGLFKDFCLGAGYSAVIKGLRNSQDFEYEKTQQYWNEDLGVDLPTFYVISDRKLVHVSSSAIRAIRSFEK